MDMEKDGGMMQQRLIICSNVLPVRLARDPLEGWTATMELDVFFEDGPMYAGMLELEKEGYEIIYVGVPGIFVPKEEHELVEQVLRKMNCYPVFLDIDRAHNHFQGFCKGILWPTFHNVIDIYHRGSQKKKREGDETDANSLSSSDVSWKPPRSWGPMEAEICWPDYCAANRQFSATVIEAYNEGDIIWTHDYHLLLLPSFIYRKLPNANTGLFLHVPFPSSECFRTLANREEILRAMLCTNHLGFHLFEHARHFLTAAKRMLGLPYEAKRGGVIGIKYQGRLVSITCMHTGISPEVLMERLASDEVKQMSHRFAPMFANTGGTDTLSHGYRVGPSSGPTKLLVGIDEIEGIRGISFKLLAFERFLSMYPRLRRQVFFKQIGIRLDSRPADYEQSRKEIEQLVSKINRKWGRVVSFEEREMMMLDERLALLKATDVFINSPLRGGLNVVPFEYVMARNDPPGCIVLSEFSTASRVLHGALKISPFKTEEFAVTIEKALTMPLPELKARHSRNTHFVLNNTLVKWCKRTIADIRAAQEDEAPLLRHGFGFGVGASRSKNNVGLVELDVVALVEAYKHAKKRLLFLDYSGSLVETTSIDLYLKNGGQARSWHYAENGKNGECVGPRSGGCLETRDPISDSVRSTLVELCQDRRNTVVVISNDLRAEVDHALAGIPNLGLIAESGYVYKLNSDEEWQSVVDEDATGDWYGGAVEPDPSEDWQLAARSIIQPYTERTNGAFCWSAPSAVSFNYILADPELGVLQAENLFTELEMALAGLPVRIDKGKGFVTATLAGVNRGAAVSAVISKVLGGANEDGENGVILAVGDDVEDERTFAAAAKSSLEKKFCVRVGWTEKKTKASFYVEDASDVGDFLNKIVTSTRDASIKFRRSVSTSQLTSNFITKDSMLAFSEDKTRNGMQSNGQRRFLGMGRSTSISNFGRVRRGSAGRAPPPVRTSISSNALPHSPSYIATPEESAMLFAGESDLQTLAEAKVVAPVDETYSSITQQYDPRPIPPTAQPQSAMRSEGSRKKNESVTWDVPSRDGNGEMKEDPSLADSLFLTSDDGLERSSHQKGMLDKGTIQLILSGFLGAGLMFIMLNTGKSHDRLSKI